MRYVCLMFVVLLLGGLTGCGSKNADVVEEGDFLLEEDDGSTPIHRLGSAFLMVYTFKVSAIDSDEPSYLYVHYRNSEYDKSSVLLRFRNHADESISPRRAKLVLYSNKNDRILANLIYGAHMSSKVVCGLGDEDAPTELWLTGSNLRLESARCSTELGTLSGRASLTSTLAYLGAVIGNLLRIVVILLVELLLLFVLSKYADLFTAAVDGAVEAASGYSSSKPASPQTPGVLLGLDGKQYTSVSSTGDGKHVTLRDSDGNDVSAHYVDNLLYRDDDPSTPLN